MTKPGQGGVLEWESRRSSPQGWRRTWDFPVSQKINGGARLRPCCSELEGTSPGARRATSGPALQARPHPGRPCLSHAGPEALGVLGCGRAGSRARGHLWTDEGLLAHSQVSPWGGAPFPPVPASRPFSAGPHGPGPARVRPRLPRPHPCQPPAASPEPPSSDQVLQKPVSARGLRCKRASISDCGATASPC